MDYKHFVSGAVSGLFEVAITHPIDVMKTRQQTGLGWPSRGEGFSTYYRGFIPRIAGVMPMRLVFWGVQGSVNARYKKNAHWWERSIVIGGAVGASQTLIDCPIENRKTYLITREKAESVDVNRRFWWDKISYGGFMPNLYRNVSFCVVFFGAHQLAKDRGASDVEKLGVSMAGAGTACVVTQPLDCVKTYRQKARAGRNVSTVSIMRELGIRNLWSGLVGRSLTSCVGMGVGFWVYDWIIGSLHP